MRFPVVLPCAIALLAASPGFAQSLPGGLSGPEAMMLYQALTPQQKQMLAANALRGRESISPTDALAWYQSLTPQQKQQAKEWAKAQAAANPGLKEQAKAWYKSWRGQ